MNTYGPCLLLSFSVKSDRAFYEAFPFTTASDSSDIITAIPNTSEDVPFWKNPIKKHTNKQTIENNLILKNFLFPPLCLDLTGHQGSSEPPFAIFSMSDVRTFNYLFRNFFLSGRKKTNRQCNEVLIECLHRHLTLVLSKAL